MGRFGCRIAPEYGGLGLSTVTYARIIERISEEWMSLSGILNSHLIMAAAVQRNGTEAQKRAFLPRFATGELRGGIGLRSEEHTSELQSLMRISYAVFCLKKNNRKDKNKVTH